jgi:futalosine hydrolase
MPTTTWRSAIATMRILVVAATLPEIAALVRDLTPRSEMAASTPAASARSAGVGHGLQTVPTRHLTARHHDLDFLVTGVGMVATAASTSRALTQNTYDVALNFGVCGSFVTTLLPGTVVHVVSDRIAELGAEDDDRFLTIDEMGLPGEPAFVSDSPPDSAVLRALPRANGITVNTVHGRAASIADVVARFHPDVESMEGAGFMHACRIAGVAFAQIRAVSNVVEKRNRAVWKLDDAIDALNRTAMAVIEDL